MASGALRTLRRRLLVIGGGDVLAGPGPVLRRFVRLAGGPDARIALVEAPIQGRDDGGHDAETTQGCRDLLGSLGVAQVSSVRSDSLADRRSDAGRVTQIGDATAVLVLGRSRVGAAESVVLAGSPMGVAIRSAYQRGAVLAGTCFTAELGLLPDVLIDQHFDRRSGPGRLLALVARSPDLIGLGVEGNAAALVTDDRDLEVVGDGAAYVIDASAAVTDAGGPAPGQPPLISGAVVHSLPAGTRFDLTRRAATSLAHRRTGRPVERVVGP